MGWFAPRRGRVSDIGRDVVGAPFAAGVRWPTLRAGHNEVWPGTAATVVVRPPKPGELRVLLSARPAGPKAGATPGGPEAPGTAPEAGDGPAPRIHRNVLLLGINSLLTDISSESVNAVLPLYLINTLGFTALGFGVFDGIYQGMSAILRIFGGMFADRRQRHKEVAGFGYFLSAACKLGLLASTTAAPTAGILFLDRTGKGVRTAPRDALISLSSAPERMGESFGIHRALDTVGALIGPLLAFALLSVATGAYDSVFVVSFCMAVLGLGVLVFFVQNPPRERVEAARAQALTKHGTRQLMANKAFRRIVLAGAVLSVVTISDAFVYVSYQKQSHMGSRFFPLLFVGTALAYLLFAVPLGRLADRIGPARVFLGGHVMLLGWYFVLRVGGPGSGFLTIALILGLLGTYYAATDGVLMALGSAVIPDELRSSGLAWLTTVTTAKLGRLPPLRPGVRVLGAEGAVTCFLVGMVVALPVALFVVECVAGGTVVEGCAVQRGSVHAVLTRIRTTACGLREANENCGLDIGPGISDFRTISQIASIDARSDSLDRPSARCYLVRRSASK